MNTLSIELIVPQQITISRSFERTVNPKNYAPGRDYESVKFSAFRSRQIPVDTSNEELNQISEDLFKIVKAEVETQAEEYIKGLKKAAGILIEPTGSDYKAIAEFIVGFEGATTSEAVKSVSEAIKGQKDTLNEVQLEYLRHIHQKVMARILD